MTSTTSTRTDAPRAHRFVVGADHAGFPLKQVVVGALRALGYEVSDLGVFDETPVDYPDISEAVARAATPPSSIAMRFSNTSCVGFMMRV